MLDEPTEGHSAFDHQGHRQGAQQLKAEREFSMLVSEQVLSFTMEIADRFLIIEKGRVRLRGYDATGSMPPRFTRYLTV